MGAATSGPDFRGISISHMHAHTPIRTNRHTHTRTHSSRCRFLSQPRHILQLGAAGCNKVRQENLTGIFLFVPELRVGSQTLRTERRHTTHSPPHTHTHQTHRRLSSAGCCLSLRRTKIHRENPREKLTSNQPNNQEDNLTNNLIDI